MLPELWSNKLWPMGYRKKKSETSSKTHVPRFALIVYFTPSGYHASRRRIPAGREILYTSTFNELKLDVYFKQAKLIVQAKTKAEHIFYAQRLSGAWGHYNHWE